jgi:tyrosinase
MELEGNSPILKPHNAGHRVVGGVLADTWSSPGGRLYFHAAGFELTSASEPLFYLHHANLDRIWWNWQMMDAHKRLHEISGRSTVDPPYKNVTLDFMLHSSTLAPPVPIRDVMNIFGPVLCYNYV